MRSLKQGTLKKVGKDPRVDAVEQLIKIPGIGESTAIKLYDTYKIETIPDLVEFYTIDKSIINDKQAIGLKYHIELQERIPRSEMNTWNDLFNILFLHTIESMKEKPLNPSIQLMGSYKRGLDTSGDVDFLISSETHGAALMKRFTEVLISEEIINKDNILSSGPTKLMAIGKISKINRHIDIFYFPNDVYSFASLFLTGSGVFNQDLRLLANKKGYSLNERTLRKGSTTGPIITSEEIFIKIGKRKIETEEDIFNFLGLQYISPDKRTPDILKK